MAETPRTVTVQVKPDLSSLNAAFGALTAQFQAMQRAAQQVMRDVGEGIREAFRPRTELEAAHARAVWVLDAAVERSRADVLVPLLERRTIVLETRAFVRGAMGQAYGLDLYADTTRLGMTAHAAAVQAYRDGLDHGGYTRGHVPLVLVP